MSPVDPKILRVITRLNIGGASRQAIYLNRVLPERGFSSLLVWGAEGKREGIVPPQGVHLHIKALQRELRPFKDLAASRLLSRVVKLRAPHIVHSHLAKAGALARWAARENGVPLIVHTYHGHTLSEYFSAGLTRAFLMLESRLAKSTDALLAVSPEIRDELLEMGVGTPDQWHVVRDGIDLRDFEALPSRADARKRLDLPLEPPLVGIVGRLVPIKGHSTFIQAASLISQEIPTVHFVIAGDGELRPQIEEAARSRLQGRVHFTGWISDLPAIYSALNVVVLTSKSEGTPAAAIEAGASRRPVIAFRVGGVTDVVQHGSTGLLVSAGDIRSLAAEVVRIIRNPSDGQSLGENARTLVRGRFSAARLADEVAGLYGELLASKGYLSRA